VAASFEESSKAGQVRRLRQLALSALERHDVDVRRVKLLVHVENTTFQVDGADGRFVLRINRPRRHSLAVVRSELMWLEALRRDTDLVVPDPVRNRSGDLVTTTGAPGVPEELDTVLFRWVSGRFPGRSVAVSTIEKLGAFTARLHLHAEGWTPPKAFIRNDVEWGTKRAPGEMAQEFDGALATATRVTAAQLRTFRAAREVVEPRMKALGKGKQCYGLLHSDLHLANALFERGEARAIDFDDCGFGHFMNDCGITLWYLQGRPNFAELREAYLRGYRGVRELPKREEDLLESFQAARTLFMCSWFARRTDHPGLRKAAPRFWTRSARDLKRFLSGKPQLL
jgi:Ser/Thr protein kinase RdoA (MazF antagonist)